MQGLIEAAVHTASGSSGFIVYHCTANRAGDGQLRLTLNRLFGDMESRTFTIPASRHVYQSADSDGSTLVIVESGVVSISLRPTASATLQWADALKADQDESDGDVFEPLPSCGQQACGTQRARQYSSTSSSSSDDDGQDRGAYYPRRDSSLKRRHYSLDAGMESAQSAATPHFSLHQSSSYPEMFAEEQMSAESPDISRPPSEGDLVSYV